MAQISEPSQIQVNKQLQQDKTKPYEDIPVLYVWFGKTVPEDYLISLSQLNYPVIFLKNPKIERKFNRQLFDIEKSDYYRLWYLYEHGGLYSDFDNTIDYPCLMKLLEPYRTQDKLIFMTDNKHTRQKTQQITTNLIFAPYPKMPVLKKMLDAIDETKERVWQFAGIKFVGQFEEPIEMQMGECVKHSYDWSWFQASNEVLGLSAEAHPKYAKKLEKKQDIIDEKQKLKGKLFDQVSYNEYLEASLSEKAHEKALLQSQVAQVHKKVIEICPKAQQILVNFNQKLIKPEDVPQLHPKLSTEMNFTTNQKVSSTQMDDQERTRLWRKIKKLQSTNEKLEYEKEIYKLEVYGSIFTIVLALVVLICFAFKKRKNKFKKLSSRERPSEIEE